ncbi:primase-helicase family protein [Mesorhizobium sp. M0130]|uniref:primase-helicase family protein n=1 Tax=Mesorhizobium sp. M0130 TaxID=2956887 RepID=UPI00333B94AF
MTKPILSSLHQISSVRAYVDRIGAEVRSIRTAVVKESHGKYWDDVATITFGEGGIVSIEVADGRSPKTYEPEEAEAKAMEIECGQFTWPVVQLVRRWNKHDEPPELQQAPDDKVFVFYDVSGNILMKQLRGNELKGEPKYRPYTLWDDGKIRQLEPDGLLPLWGLDQLKKNFTTVFLHEGAKAARRMAELVSGGTLKDRDEFAKHPWHNELDGAAHLGWIGGAQNPGRTDWSVPKKNGVQRVYIVADNDVAGVSAIAKIAKRLRFPTYSIQFTKLWPVSFDLADPFPKEMFGKRLDGTWHYKGPPFRSVVHPATYMTDFLPNPKGKPTAVLREHAKDAWGYVEQSDLFVCMDMPEIVYDAKVLNNMLASFSGTTQIAQTIVLSKRGRIARMCYDPSMPSGVVTYEGSSAFNTHIPSAFNQHIRPWNKAGKDDEEPTTTAPRGSPEPFLGYLANLFPIDVERKEVERWIATLIAKPERKMDYGLLLISKVQGVGKTTLGESILRPIVGYQNTGFPDETAINNSQFTDWCAEKRLVLIEEIYSGDSWATYNKLKSKITGKTIPVNRKFQRPYDIQNWVHIIASSNSKLAIRVENSDRRWFIPEVTEVPWSHEKWVEFYNWLECGGLEIVVNWAERYDDYVSHGQTAPHTKRKSEIIDASESAAERAITDLCEIIIAEERAPKKDGEKDNPLEHGVVLSSTHVEAWVKEKEPKAYATKHTMAEAMAKAGLIRIEGRFDIGQGKHVCLASPKAMETIQPLVVAVANSTDEGQLDDAKRNLRDGVRKLVKRPDDAIKVDF